MSLILPAYRLARDDTEARAEKLGELATKHYQRLRGQLQAGNADLASAIGEAISTHMTDDICNEQLTYAVMPNGGAASPRFKKLIENALELMAENAALREVEQLERQREQSQDEARIDRAVMDLEARGAYWIADEH
jgi:hypothetical protein